MLPQTRFIACNCKIHTFFKARGETLSQGSATFPSPRARTKLCNVWLAVLIFYQQFRSFAVYNFAKTWEFTELESEQTPDFHSS